MLATAIYLFRGTLYVYQGEKIGMTNAYHPSIEQHTDVKHCNYYRIPYMKDNTPAQALL